MTASSARLALKDTRDARPCVQPATKFENRHHLRRSGIKQPPQILSCDRTACTSRTCVPLRRHLFTNFGPPSSLLLHAMQHRTREHCRPRLFLLNLSSCQRPERRHHMRPHAASSRSLARHGGRQRPALLAKSRDNPICRCSRVHLSRPVENNDSQLDIDHTSSFLINSCSTQLVIKVLF